MRGLPIDPRWTPHIPGAQRMNDVLRQMGDVIPPLHTAEDVAKARVLPEAFATQETALPVHSRTIPGPAGNLRVRVAVPPTVDAVYLDIHGGGFCIGWPEQKDVQNARLAAAAGQGCSGASRQSTLTTAAADWLIAHGRAEFGSDVVLLGGDSAGGNLAALVALQLRDRGGPGLSGLERVAGLFLLYGAFDLSGTPSSRNRGDALILTTEASTMFHENYLPGRDGEGLRDPAVSPLYADLSGLPPALFCAGAIDPLLDDSLFMAARWQAAGNEAELYVVPESPHGFAAFPSPMAGELELLHAEWVRDRLAS